MEDYSHIQKPDLGYRYEFATDELDAMDECLAAHGFAIIKDVLPPEIVAKLKQAVWDGTDPGAHVATGREPHAARLDRVRSGCLGGARLRAFHGHSPAPDRHG